MFQLRSLEGAGMMHRTFLGAWLVGWLLTLTATNAAETKLRRPLAEQGPTEVSVVMFLLDIDEIDSAEQNFHANLFYEVSWHDPRLQHDGPDQRTVQLAEIWHPELLIVNQQKVWPTFPPIAYVSLEGGVLIRQRVWGPFSQPLDVRDFPFDVQDFEMRLASAASNPEGISFVPHPDELSGIAPAFSLPDWEILSWELSFDNYSPSGRPTGLPSFAFTFRAKRHGDQYILKVILPLVMIVLMSMLVFWMEPKEAGAQIGLAATSMLTLIAYRFMVGGKLPPVPYLTRMDYFILGSTVLVFAALIESAITSIMAEAGFEQRARWLDRVCRVLFPVMFVAVFIVSFLA